MGGAAQWGSGRIPGVAYPCVERALFAVGEQRPAMRVGHQPRSD
jgi:hypothetical protein